MAVPVNNQVVTVTAIAGDVLTVDGTLVAEVPTATNRIEVIGFQFPSSGLEIEFTGSQLSLVRNNGSFIDDGYNVGEWIFVGGDMVGASLLAQFDNNEPGYVRIQAIEADRLILQEPTWVPQTDVGFGKEIKIYLGTFIRNEQDPALIKRRTYNLERTLGQDADGVQSEYVIGSTPDEFTLNLTAAEKITTDMSFMSLTNQTRTGAVGLKPGDRSEGLEIENAYNASSDVFQLRLFVNDPLQVTPISLYAKVMEATVVITNTVNGNKCIGNLGSFDTTIGDFMTSGDLEVYFSTVEAIEAVRRNADVGFNVICGRDNSGLVYDVPLLCLGGGRVNIEKDEPIKLPLEKTGARNEMGFTMGATYFNYLPDAAMPEIN